MYRALYRKWRPATFADVIGQESIVTALQSQLLHDKVGHAYLFTGTRGTGKTTCAKIFAKAVNCQSPNGANPCCVCSICKGIDGGSVMDVVEIDAASNNGVDNIRDLRDETAYTPSEGKYKVYIIDEVHMLSTAAFNALLKIMEEPPSHVIFILATTEIHKVPATILSRCQRYDFVRIPPDAIAERLLRIAGEEKLALAPDAAQLIARLADGAMRDALSILDTCSGVSPTVDADTVRRMAGVTDKSYLFSLSQCIAARDVPGALTLIAQLRERSVDIKRLCDELVLHYRNLMLAGVAGAQQLLTGVSVEEEQQYLDAARTVPQAAAIRGVKAFCKALDKMATSADARIELEMAVFALCGDVPAAQPQPQATMPVQAAATAPIQTAVTLAQAAPVAPPQQGAATSAAPPNDVPWCDEPPPEMEYTAPTAPRDADRASSAVPPPATQTAAPVVATPPVPAVNQPDVPTAPTVQTVQPAMQGTAQNGTPVTAQPTMQGTAQSGTPVTAQPAMQGTAQSGTPVTAQSNTQAAAAPGTSQAKSIAPAAPPELFAAWDAVIAAMEPKDKMLFVNLRSSKAYFDGKRVRIDGGALFLEYMRRNSYSTDLIKATIAEVTGHQYAIGPYEHPTETVASGPTALETLARLESEGVPVIYQDKHGKQDE